MAVAVRQYDPGVTKERTTVTLDAALVEEAHRAADALDAWVVSLADADDRIVTSDPDDVDVLVPAAARPIRILPL